MDNKILLGIIIAIIITFYLIYISLIKKKNNAKDSASGIDVQLKKRYDLIPNLMTMASKYMEHEKNLMSEITKLRNDAINCDFSTNPQEKINLDELLTSKMSQFKLTAENYPDMKSNEMMNTAMISLNEVEEHIAASRRFYNSSVKELKNALEIFPSSLIAKLIGIKDEFPFFKATAEETKSISAANYFK